MILLPYAALIDATADGTGSSPSRTSARPWPRCCARTPGACAARACSALNSWSESAARGTCFRVAEWPTASVRWRRGGLTALLSVALSAGSCCCVAATGVATAAIAGRLPAAGPREVRGARPLADNPRLSASRNKAGSRCAVATKSEVAAAKKRQSRGLEEPCSRATLIRSCRDSAPKLIQPVAPGGVGSPRRGT